MPDQSTPLADGGNHDCVLPKLDQPVINLFDVGVQHAKTRLVWPVAASCGANRLEVAEARTFDGSTKLSLPLPVLRIRCLDMTQGPKSCLN